MSSLANVNQCTFWLPFKFSTGEMVPVEDGEDLILLPLSVYVYLDLVFVKRTILSYLSGDIGFLR